MRITHFATRRSFSGERRSRFIGLAVAASAFLMVLACANDARAAFAATNLVSDIPGTARRTDFNLVNCWGIAVGSSGTIWVANNGTGTSTLYDQSGVPQSLVVSIPPSATNTEGANPTGIVFNSGSGFVVSENGLSGPAVFIFVGEDGSISGWSPTVASDHAIIAVDDGDEGAVYKGAALGLSSSGMRLYVTNFHEGVVSVYDDTFGEIDNEDAFVDPTIPRGYAPFGIENINGLIYVTYAKQDRDAEDDVAGPGHGFINVFDTDGNFVKRLVSHGALNSPWGLALAPDRKFGPLTGALLVGNFGDGEIHGYDINTGALLGAMSKPDGTPLREDELWALHVIGNTVYFTAGIVEEEHGLFGSIQYHR
ncbi:MAG TPA: TIGR03118 family protein [Chthoniobacterales bacterium]|jgi:uncharacterized protein (TIGR03118 family)